MKRCRKKETKGRGSQGVRTRQEGGEREDRRKMVSLTCDGHGVTEWFRYCSLASDTEKDRIRL